MLLGSGLPAVCVSTHCRCTNMETVYSQSLPVDSNIINKLSIRHWNRLYSKLPRGNKWRLMEEKIHRHAQNPSSFAIFWWNPPPHQPLGISRWRNPEAMHWDQTEVMHQQWKVHILTTHITGLEDILDDSGHEDYLGLVVLQANHDISIHNMHTSCRSNPLAFQSTVNHSEDRRNSTQPIFL